MLKRHHNTEALILKASPYGEGHTIVTALTAGGSQLKAMAYGSRKLTSRIGGHLSPLTRGDLALYKSRDMDIIKQVFDITSCYFPITFTPPPNDPYGTAQYDRNIVYTYVFKYRPSLLLLLCLYTSI